MALDQAANFIRGRLTAAVGPADTTFEVANASQYPDPSTRQYNLVVWNADQHARPDQDPSVEIVRVSARDTTADELTVARGQENTSAAPHPNGAAVQLSPTAKVVEDVQTKTSGLSDDGTALSIDGLYIGPDNGPAYRRVERRSLDGGSTVQFSGLDSDTMYRVVIQTQINTDGPTTGQLNLRFNGDGASSGSYDYWDESGTKQSDQNEILIYEVSQNAGATVILDINSGYNDFTGVHNTFLPQRTARISSFSRNGGYQNQGLSSIEFHAEMNSSVFFGGFIELWEREQ